METHLWCTISPNDAWAAGWGTRVHQFHLNCVLERWWRSSENATNNASEIDWNWPIIKPAASVRTYG